MPITIDEMHNKNYLTMCWCWWHLRSTINTIHNKPECLIIITIGKSVFEY
jgi:hypothetical protein